MKVISIWQPWAQLIVHGFKRFETRTWAPPKSVIGQRIGIASTKNVLPKQLAAFNEEEFQFFWNLLDEAWEFDQLVRGYLLGTVVLDSFEEITEEFLDDITREEKAYGWYKLGDFAWRLKQPELLAHPIPIKGAQGLYEWKGFENGAQTQGADNNRPQRPSNLRPHLSLCQ
ncbi:ASCH domain-containing protein [Rhizobium lentis]|uniref:ASCH domain-containing protein n=1 Tax=Rhizobium lentis TaxID=1138194 RepID=UPI001C82B49E|nr:ASCH domain-containing protein [Rhizobium lentis]MBX5130704.1 ASCH domain-containing protein [Rhizobium lentis]